MELNANRRDRDTLAGRIVSREHRVRATWHSFESPFGYPPPGERIDERIRQLCATLVASDGQQLQTLAELRSALHEHSQRLRSMAARKLLGSRTVCATHLYGLRMPKR